MNSVSYKSFLCPKMFSLIEKQEFFLNFKEMIFTTFKFNSDDELNER